MPHSPSIFISYSTQDEHIARTARNLFEERGHDVQLLKFHQSMTDDFIMDFLRKEVAANDWLVVIESEHARDSHWVMFERSVAGIYHKRVYQIDITPPAMPTESESQNAYLRAQVASISRRLSVFISYTHHDQDIARRIHEALAREGYEAWDATTSLTPGENWQQRIHEEIERTMERGVMLVLISDATNQSAYVRAELDSALQLAQSGKGFIIPCLVSKPKNGYAAMAPFSLLTYQYLDMTRNFDQAMALLTSRLAEL